MHISEEKKHVVLEKQKHQPVGLEVFEILSYNIILLCL